MDDLLIKTILPVITAVVGWTLAARQYYLNNSEENLEKELKRLKETFHAIDREPISYKSLSIRYPLSITNEYRLLFLRINKRQVIYNIDTSLSLYDNFYAYIENLSRYLEETELTLRQMLTLYDIFVENLEQRDLIDQTFQVMYEPTPKSPIKELFFLFATITIAHTRNVELFGYTMIVYSTICDKKKVDFENSDF